MVLDARHHASIYNKLVPVLGDDDTNALMTNIPTAEGDELVTRLMLRAQTAEIRGEIAEVRVEVAGLRGELKTDIAELRADMNDRFRRQTVWTTSTMFVGMALITALNRGVS